MSLRNEQEEFAKDVIKLMSFIFSSGYTLTMGEAMRTTEQQKIYVQTGRSKTMNSYHLKKCAIDLNVFRDGVLLCSKEDMQPFGDYWTSLHPVNQWGGNWHSFKDIPHFERHI